MLRDEATAMAAPLIIKLQNKTPSSTVLKILFSEQGRLLARCRIEREKFYPGP